MKVIPRLDDGEQRVFFKAGGEWCYLWTPGDFRRDEPTPVVIHHHGARGYVKEGSADWLEADYKVVYLRAAMEGGRCAVAGSHACGDHWGNAGAVTANAALFDALTECPHVDTDRTGLMGGGLGGALVWNSVLGPLAGRVKTVVVMQAVAWLEAVIREQKFKAPCLRAYGLPEDAPDEEAIARVAPHDPLPRIRGLPRGTPLPHTAIYHGKEDANIPAATSAIPLAEALREVGGTVELEVFPSVGHDVYGMGRPIEDRLKALFAKTL
ncbi:MAG: alpha/beta hydrolase family protein [Candidatus Bathyarchaeia archaeon]